MLTENVHNSPTSEIYNAASGMGIFNILSDSTCDRKTLCTKKSWSRYVWDRAWKLEDLYWASTSIIKKDNDLLVKVMVKTKYLICWEMSDKFSTFLRTCETMAKLVSHASRLKCDDIRLNGLVPSYRACSECDLYLKEDLLHIGMQCPTMEKTRGEMYNELSLSDQCLDKLITDGPQEVFGLLIGRPIEGFSQNEMYAVWYISGKYICEMYRQTCRAKDRAGVR